MIQLINKDYERRYIEYIKKSDIILDEGLKNSFISLLKEINIEDRLELWKNFKVSVNSISQLPKLANPFFMGFGNPESDLLFIGKEKAFNTYNNPELFFHESINNTLQWELINSGSNFIDEIFDPRNPRKYHNFKIKANHTWGKYAKIVDLKNDLKQDFLSIPEKSQPTFFDYCFLTEINHLPSKYSVGEGLVDVRKELLKNPFYKKFKNIVIGAKGYLSNEQIEEIFNVTRDPKPKLLGKKGKNLTLEINATIFRNENQQVIYCSQLSGSTGWTNEAIRVLAGMLK